MRTFSMVVLMLVPAPWYAPVSSVFGEEAASDSSRQSFMKTAFRGKLRGLASSVLSIEADGKPVGMGLLIGEAPASEVVAVRHLVAGANRVDARTKAGDRLSLELLGEDRIHGVSLFRIRDLGGRRLGGAALDPSLEPMIGQWLLVGGQEDDPFSAGIVGAVNRSIENMRRLPEDLTRMNLLRMPLESQSFVGVLQHDARLTDAMLGSPVCDREGRVLGVNVYRVARGTAYALPVKLLTASLATLRSRRDIVEESRGWLGLSVRSLTGVELQALRERGFSGGVFVESVLPGGAGKEAGLRAGDIVIGLTIHGEENDLHVEVFEAGQLVDRVRKLPLGSTVRLRVVRGGFEVADIKALAPRERR